MKLDVTKHRVEISAEEYQEFIRLNQENNNYDKKIREFGTYLHARGVSHEIINSAFIKVNMPKLS